MDEKGYLTTYACIIEYRRSLLRISTGISNYSIISLEKNKQWYVTGHYTVFCHFGLKYMQRTPSCEKLVSFCQKEWCSTGKQSNSNELVIPFIHVYLNTV